jgi:hypothetical protein
VFGHLARSPFIGLLALPCLLPPMLLLPPLVNAFLTGIVIVDNIRIRRNPAPISPPGPHRPRNT